MSNKYNPEIEMAPESLPIQVIEAIDTEDIDSINRLFNENPEQVAFETFFAGQTWLGYAARNGKLNALKALQQIGIGIDTPDSTYGIRPICVASGKGQSNIVLYLLDQGATMDVDLSVRNPLFAAIVCGSKEVVDILLAAGLDSTVRYDSETMTGMDAVAFALMRGEIEIAHVIALHNASGDVDSAEAAVANGLEVAKANAG